jgi:hypothetical protein
VPPVKPVPLCLQPCARVAQHSYTIREFGCFFPQAKGRLADAFQAPLDGIPRECVASKRLPV